MSARTLTSLSATVAVMIAGQVVAIEPAHAEDTSSAALTMAQALFEEGTELLGRGDLDAACPKLAESQRLSPAGGTVYNLAVCLERSGKTASAYVAYDEALARATRDGLAERERTIRERLADIKPRLVRFVVRPPALVDTRAAAARGDVRFDGERMPPETWNTLVPVDPGSHEITISADGHLLAHETLRLDEPGRVYEWQVPASSSFDAPPPPKQVTRHEATRSDATRSDATRRSTTRTTAATITLVSGGLLLGTGAIFGTMAIAAHGASNAECPSGPTSCTAAGVDAERDAKSYAWGANIGIGAGLIALAAGAVLLLTK